MPVDYLKLDIEFVSDLLTNDASRHVVQAVVSLAHDFGSKTVAEGVEDADTLALLGELGVDHAQGFHLARPKPFTERPGDGDEPRTRRAPRQGRAHAKRPGTRSGVGSGVV